MADMARETWALVKRSPTSVPGHLGRYAKTWSRALFYRRKGTYVDERLVLDYYRKREDQLRKAASMKSWLGMTNFFETAFQGNAWSMINSTISLRQIPKFIAGGGKGLLGVAAEAEANRELVITALSLELYRSKNGRYPDRLEALVPEFLKFPPTDFMDGKPFRFRLMNNRFLLYSVGLDGKDDAGIHFAFGLEARPPATGLDLVWPRPLRSD